MRRIIAIATVMCFLANSASFAAGGMNLAAPLMFDDIADNTPSAKHMTLACMVLLAKILRINELDSNVLDNETDPQAIKDAFAERYRLKHITVYENPHRTALEDMGARVELFPQGIRQVAKGSHIFYIPVRINNAEGCLLLFSTKDGLYPIVPCTLEEFKEKQAEIIALAERDKLMSRTPADRTVIADYWYHEEAEDPFWREKMEQPDAHFVCTPEMAHKLLFESMAFMLLPDELWRRFEIDEKKDGENIKAICDGIKGKRLIFVHANFVELPRIRMKDERGNPHTIKVDSHISNENLFIALNDMQWRELGNIRGFLRGDKPFDWPTANSKCPALRDRVREAIIHKTGVLCGLNGYAKFDAASEGYFAENALSELYKLSLLQAGDGEEIARLKAQVHNLRPIDLDNLSGTNANGDPYVRDYAGGQSANESQEPEEAKRQIMPDQGAKELWQVILAAPAIEKAIRWRKKKFLAVVDVKKGYKEVGESLGFGSTPSSDTVRESLLKLKDLGYIERKSDAHLGIAYYLLDLTAPAKQLYDLAQDCVRRLAETMHTKDTDEEIRCRKILLVLGYMPNENAAELKRLMLFLGRESEKGREIERVLLTYDRLSAKLAAEPLTPLPKDGFKVNLAEFIPRCYDEGLPYLFVHQLIASVEHAQFKSAVTLAEAVKGMRRAFIINGNEKGEEVIGVMDGTVPLDVDAVRAIELILRYKGLLVKPKRIENNDDVEPIVVKAMVEKRLAKEPELTREDTYRAVFSILSSQHPKLAMWLGRICELIKEPREKVSETIERLPLSKLDKDILKLAFFTPGEGMGRRQERATTQPVDETPDLLQQALDTLPEEYYIAGYTEDVAIKEKWLSFSTLAQKVKELFNPDKELMLGPTVTSGSAFIFSEGTTFNAGLGVLLPKLVRSGVKVAVVARTDGQRKLIEDLNGKLHPFDNVISAENPEEAQALIRNAAKRQSGSGIVQRFYYFKLAEEESPHGVLVVNITKQIIDAIGEACNLGKELIDRLRAAASLFSQA